MSRVTFRIAYPIHVLMRWMMIVLGGCATTTAARADVFIFEKRQTDVRFVCGTGLFAVEGRVLDVDGAIDVDDRTPEHSRVQVTMKTASITTGQSMVDETLKGNQFFNVAVYPTIDFKGRSTSRNGDSHAKIRGKLSVRGVTRPIRMRASDLSPEKLKGNRPTAKRVFWAKFPIRRSEFGMGGWETMVADKCEVRIKAALRKRASAKSKSAALNGNRSKLKPSISEVPKVEEKVDMAEPMALGRPDTSIEQRKQRNFSSQTIPLPIRRPTLARRSRKRPVGKKIPKNWVSRLWEASAK